VQQRAEYLMRLMPRLNKSFAERIPSTACLMERHLTLPQLHILQFLIHQGQATMSDMAKWGCVAMPTMTEAVNRLVRQRIVERIRDANDRRIVIIRVTGQGKKEFTKWSLLARRRFVAILGSMSEKNQKKMVQAFKTLETVFIKSSPAKTQR
jgi:DNA-binding MarR family transcriptional regulator